MKLPAVRCTELVAAGSAHPFEVGRRHMREWVRVDEIDGARWLQLAQEARAYVTR